jgi:hypothetical protein
MPPQIKIALFEDTTQTRSKVLEALKKHLGADGSVIPIEAGQFNEQDDKQRTYEDRLEGILSKPPYEDLTLVVGDRDLSKSQDIDFRGLSVNAVVAACERLAVPVCAYARELESDDDYDWRGRWEENHIVLSFSEGEDELARRAVVASRGFVDIAALLKPDIPTKSSPAKILADLLAKPEYTEKIALYAVGDQNRLTEILGKAKQTENRDLIKRLAHFLGYWLWLSLLRYPGVFINEVAAGSHLNIEHDSFQKPDVQAVFKEALYTGPFADPKRPQWWRGMVDDIVANENCADGLELVRNKVNPSIGRSQCYVDPSKPAGYYCIISRKPVSIENSKGGLSWFPRGADLTRVSIPKLEEYGPWLGS